MADIVGIILSCGVILMVMWAMYRTGKIDGRHIERMHLLGILKGLPIDKLKEPADVLGVLLVTNYIVEKMREE